jgi:hypothetical protein
VVYAVLWVFVLLLRAAYLRILFGMYTLVGVGSECRSRGSQWGGSIRDGHPRLVSASSPRTDGGSLILGKLGDLMSPSGHSTPSSTYTTQSVAFLWCWLGLWKGRRFTKGNR